MFNSGHISKSSKRTLKLKIKTVRKNKTPFYDIRKVLFWIFGLFGLDLNYQHFSKRKRNFPSVCRKLTAIILIIISFLINGIPKKELILNDEMKAYYSSSVVVVCSVIIYCYLFYSCIDVANVTHINRLKRLNSMKCLDMFSSMWIIFNLVSYTLTVAFILYPFSQNHYDKFISKFFYRDLKSKNLKYFILYAGTIVHHSFMILFPNTFITMYIIACHDIKVILDSHIKQLEMYLVIYNKKIIKILSDYQNILSGIQAFESTFNTLIFVCFISKITTLLASVLLSATHGQGIFSCYIIIVNFMFITIIFQAASSVSKYDTFANYLNLKSLERIFLTNTHIPLSNLITIWRLNNSPAFTLTAWEFFCFTRDSYLCCLGSLITYILLLKNL